MSVTLIQSFCAQLILMRRNQLACLVPIVRQRLMGFGGYSIIHSFMMLNQGNNLFMHTLYVVTGCIIGVTVRKVFMMGINPS